MEFRSLRPEELDRWADHCAAVFTNDSREYFLAHYLNDPWRDPNGIFVAVDGGGIVSTVRVFRRRVWLMGERVTMGGVGEVSTKADYRGRGLAGSLLKLAVEWMEREGLAVSLLFAGAHDFYRKYGWECLPKPFVTVEGAAAPPCGGRALTKADLPGMRAVDDAAEKTDWMVARGEAYWNTWMAAAPGRAAGAFEGGGLVAWLAYDGNGEGWSVTEFKAVPGHEQKYAGLCALAAELEGWRSLPFTAPAWLPLPGAVTGSHAANYSMVRLNLPFAVRGRAIGDTPQLIEATRECRDSGLDHF